MENKINEDLKQAMRDKDTLRVETLRSVKAAFTNAKTEKNADEFNDEKALKVIQKLVKQREEAAATYLTGNRADLAQKENDEKAILASYLPKFLAEDDLNILIKKTVEEYAFLKRDFGKAIGVIGAKARELGYLVDNKLVSEVLRIELK